MIVLDSHLYLSMERINKIVPTEEGGGSTCTKIGRSIGLTAYRGSGDDTYTISLGSYSRGRGIRRTFIVGVTKRKKMVGAPENGRELCNQIMESKFRLQGGKERAWTRYSQPGQLQKKKQAGPIRQGQKERT